MRGRQVGIVEERRRAPGREAAELDESLGHVRRGADGTRLAEEAAGVTYEGTQETVGCGLAVIGWIRPRTRKPSASVDRVNVSKYP